MGSRRGKCEIRPLIASNVAHIIGYPAHAICCAAACDLKNGHGANELQTSFSRINDGFDDTRAVGHTIPFYRHCLHETSADGLGQSGGFPFGKRS